MNITPEAIQALEILRNRPGSSTEDAYLNLLDAIDALDNAGIFSAIDEAADHDPAPVSKCTCTGLQLGKFKHFDGCPGDPAEWGDRAYVG